MGTTINYIDEFNLTFTDLLSGFENHQMNDESELILIVNSDYEVSFSNSKKEFWTKLKNLNELIIDPDLCPILEIFSKNKINFLTLEVTIEKGEEGFSEYKVDITKIQIGEKTYFLLVFENMNKKVKIERKINNLTYALDYGQIPVIIADNEQRVIYVSTSFEKLLRLDIEDLFRANLSEVLSLYMTVKDLGLLKNQLINHGLWKKTIVIEEESGIKYYEFKIQTIYYEEQDSFNYILTANDITDYILMHQEIRRSEGWLKAIINNINELLIVFHKEGERFLVKNANQNLKNVLKFKNVEGLKVEEIFPEPSTKDILINLRKLDAHETTLVKFETNLGSDKYFYEASGTLMLDPVDNKHYFILTFNDISERIAYERQLEIAYKEEIKLNEMKNDFLANMSHEIRTPANAIIGYSDILLEASEEGDLETVKEISSSLKEATKRAISLFDNIMEVNNAAAKNQKLDLVKIDLNHILQSVAEEFNSVASEKGLNLVVNKYSSPVVIKADWVKTHKIFHALLDNAVKYTESGRVLMKTYLENNKAIVEISDTGPGIELNKINELLKPFHQGESGYTRNFQGAGLGLTLAYRLTTLLNGVLHFHENESKGTLVKIIFPLKDLNH